MNVSINLPTKLKYDYNQPLTGQTFVSDYLKDLFVEPLVNPATPNGLTVTYDNGDPYNEDNLLSDIQTCLNGVYNVDEEDRLKQIYSKVLIYGNDKTALPFNNLLLSQAAIEEKLPEPSGVVIYKITTDIVPVTKEFLAGICKPTKLFASFGYTFKPESLGVYVKNKAVFDDFKNMLNTEIQKLNASNASADLFLSNTEFQKINLDSLSECVLISKDYSDNSFRRILIKTLFDFVNSNSDTDVGLMPFTIDQLVDPDNLMFINIEKHAKASSREISDDWDMIKKALSNTKLRMVNQKQIRRLSTSMRATKKIASMAANALTNKNQKSSKHANHKWTTTRPSNKKFALSVKKIIYKLKTVAMSENCIKSQKISFQRANRRNPDDYNKPGKIISNKYYPDLHIYCDTSGSISEENYQDAVMLMINIAKKLNVNLYFNSFSHVLSSCTKIETKGRTTKQIYKKFKEVRKVGGGTDFEQIWHYINASPKRRKEMSLIITDFEWAARTEFIRHPKNLYYMPCAGMNYTSMLNAAKYFEKSARHNDPNIRKKILM